MDRLMQKEHLIHGNHALFSSTFKPIKEQLRERADPAFVRRPLDTFLMMFEKWSLSLSKGEGLGDYVHPSPEVKLRQ